MGGGGGWKGILVKICVQIYDYTEARDSVPEFSRIRAWRAKVDLGRSGTSGPRGCIAQASRYDLTPLVLSP